MPRRRPPCRRSRGSWACGGSWREGSRGWATRSRSTSSWSIRRPTRTSGPTSTVASARPRTSSRSRARSRGRSLTPWRRVSRPPRSDGSTAAPRRTWRRIASTRRVGGSWTSGARRGSGRRSSSFVGPWSSTTPTPRSGRPCPRRRRPTRATTARTSPRSFADRPGRPLGRLSSWTPSWRRRGLQPGCFTCTARRGPRRFTNSRELWSSSPAWHRLTVGSGWCWTCSDEKTPTLCSTCVAPSS